MDTLPSHQTDVKHENDVGKLDPNKVDMNLNLIESQDPWIKYGGVKVSQKSHNLIENFEKRWTLNKESFKVSKYTLPYNIADVDASVDGESDIVFQWLKKKIWWLKDYLSMSVDERSEIMPSNWELRRGEKSAQEFINMWYEMPIAFNVTWLANDLNVDPEKCGCTSNEELASLRAEVAKLYIIKELKPYFSEEFLEKIILTDSKVLSEDPNWWSYESIPGVQITMVTWVPTVTKTILNTTKRWIYEDSITHETIIKEGDIYPIKWKKYALLEDWDMLDENNDWIPDDAYEIKVWVDKSSQKFRYIDHEKWKVVLKIW